MTKLSEVQKEVIRQITRDYGENITTHLQTNLMLGLTEEAGEVAGLMKRVLRNFPKDRERCTVDDFIDELGDVLWYLTACCYIVGTDLDTVWKNNILKLKARYGE